MHGISPRRGAELNFVKVRDIFAYHLPTLVKVECKKTLSSFFSHLPMRARTAGIRITGNCNLRCNMCGVWRTPSENELRTEEWKDVLRQLKEEGLSYVSFTGGEPLLRPDLEELVAYAHSLGFHNSIATNGFLLTEEKLTRLIRAGSETFVISVDALGEYFDAIRGVPDAYGKVRAACESLSQKCKTSNIKGFIRITLTKETLSHVMEVVEFAEQLSLPVLVSLLSYTSYYFHPAKNDGLWIGRTYYGLLDETADALLQRKKKSKKTFGQSFVSLRSIKRYFRDPLQKNIPCAKIFTRVFINPQGETFGGCLAQQSFGNVRTQKLKGILHSQEYLHAQRRMFLKECPGCSCGYEIDLKYSLRHLLEEMKFGAQNNMEKLYYKLRGKIIF